jgi:hypothetical protein
MGTNGFLIFHLCHDEIEASIKARTLNNNGYETRIDKKRKLSHSDYETSYIWEVSARLKTVKLKFDRSRPKTEEELAEAEAKKLLFNSGLFNRSNTI